MSAVYSSQFSTVRPGTRWKWRTLPVTTVRSFASAIAAICVSGWPIGVP